MPIINKSNTLQVIDDTVYVIVDGVIPDARHLHYRFDLDIATPGLKVVVESLLVNLLFDTYILADCCVPNP